MRAGRQILERTGERIAADVDVTLRLELGEAAAAIKHVARLESAAVVVTGSRGRGVVASTLLGSVSKRLVAWAERPTVVISPHAARPTGDRSRPAAKEASSRRAS